MRWKHGGSDSDAKIRPTQSQLIIIKPAFMTLEEFTARALKSDLDKARVLSGRPSSYRNIIKIIISAATTYLIVISFAITLQERQRGREREGYKKRVLTLGTIRGGKLRHQINLRYILSRNCIYCSPVISLKAERRHRLVHYPTTTQEQVRRQSTTSIRNLYTVCGTRTSLRRSLELSASLGATDVVVDDDDINLSEARPLSSEMLGSCASEFYRETGSNTPRRRRRRLRELW